MDPAAIAKHIVESFAAVSVTEVAGDSFFFFDPQNDPADRMMPFATLVTGDRHDTVSRLDRPGVHRLNVGVAKATYVGLFGPAPAFNKDGSPVDTGHDFAALDALMPHPVYAAMHWVCVLNPSDAMFETTVKPLIAEAYGIAVERQQKRAGRG